MFKANVLVIGLDELKDKLEAFYVDILKDTAKELVNVGGVDNMFPRVLLEKGLRDMTPQEVAEVAEPWAEGFVEEEHVETILLKFGVKDGLYEYISLVAGYLPDAEAGTDNKS